MAITYWTGAVSGDWDASGNWSSGVPATGDTAIFDSGTASVTGGLNQSAVNLESLFITDGFSGAIGSATLGRLQINADNVKLAGRNAAVEGGYFLSGTFNVVDMLNGKLSPLSFPGVSLAGVIGLLRCYAGRIEVADGATLAAVEGYGLSPSGLNLRLGALGSPIAVRWYGGMLTNASPVETLVIAGGSVRHEAGAMGTVELYGGSLAHLADGNITRLRAIAGKFGLDLNRNLITVADCDVWKATVDLRNAVGGATFTHGIIRHADSAVILRDAGSAA